MPTKKAYLLAKKLSIGTNEKIEFIGTNEKVLRSLLNIHSFIYLWSAGDVPLLGSGLEQFR